MNMSMTSIVKSNPSSIPYPDWTAFGLLYHSVYVH